MFNMCMRNANTEVQDSPLTVVKFSALGVLAVVFEIASSAVLELLAQLI